MPECERREREKILFLKLNLKSYFHQIEPKINMEKKNGKEFKEKYFSRELLNY